MIEQNIADEEYFLVPKRWLKSIADAQGEILHALRLGNTKTTENLGDYLSESEAKKVIGKKTTWFWKMRTSGRLPFSKIGGTNYYLKQDLLNILDKSRRI